jgi:hypothetical protein
VTRLVLAIDKRTVDQDGRLRVPGCRISKANVCPYFGREIPNFETLGLDADRVYMMYRDPEELRKAADSFNTVPLLDTHIPVTADAHAPENTVGVVSNARFEYPYLVADLTVWTQDAKDLIETEAQRELSSAYRYTADMTRGMSPEGVAFHGIMRDIKSNHVALVAEGRAGPDVLVADEKPVVMKSKFLAKLLALFPTPVDAATGLALDGALTAELEAMDSDMDDDKKKAACDAYAKELGKDAESLSDEEKTEAYRRAAADSLPGSATAPNGPVGGAPKPSMDAVVKIEFTPEFKIAVDAAIATAKAEGVAEIAAARDTIAQDAAKAVHALYAARDAVADKAGIVNLTEHKTAEAVYRYALDKLAVPHKDVPAEALAALYTASARAPTVVTVDATPFNARDIFPGLKLVTRG